MRSMTGFGTATTTNGDFRMRCEVRSVNHKGLDVKFRLPRSASHLELSLHTVVKEHVERGRVDVWVDLEHAGPAGVVRFDAERARSLIDEVARYAERDPRIVASISAAELLRLPGVLSEADSSFPADLETACRGVLRDALVSLRDSRTREGEGLKGELQRRIAACRLLVAEIAARAAAAPRELNERLRARLAPLLDVAGIDPVRIAQEAALLAERVDVGEELARLHLHLEHFETLLDQAAPAGRKLDFLCQELLRESNTTGSKCQDAKIAHAIVELKAEIERTREQVQNVE